MTRSNAHLRLNYGKTFLIGFGFFGISVLWTLYNAYVPIFLQAGNPEFASTEIGFGLKPGWTGLIMTLDNIAAFFLLPLIGVWSDRVWTRIGRRMPFILVLAPISVVSFVLIPFAVGMIPVELNGQTAQLGGPLALFMLALGVFLLAMAGFRTPVIALMPDLTPSPLRSQANGIINMMGGIGTLIATLGSSFLYKMGRITPFVFGSVLMAIAVVLLFIFVKERRDSLVAAVDETEGLGALRGIRRISPEARRSLWFLMGAIFCWFVGYNATETFLTSYGVTVLNISVAQAPLLMGVASVAFLIFAVPAGYIAARLGRRKTIIIGLIVFGALLLVNFFLRNATLIWPIMAIGGVGWALVNINSLPMVIDTAVSDADIGTYTGLYYIASQLAAIVGPILNGHIVEWFGNDYNLIFVVTPLFFFLAILCMMQVTRGEAKKITAA